MDVAAPIATVRQTPGAGKNHILLAYLKIASPQCSIAHVSLCPLSIPILVAKLLHDLSSLACEPSKLSLPLSAVSGEVRGRRQS